MTPRRGNTILFRSSQQLPSPSRILEGLFELTRRPSSGPQLTSCVASGTTKKQGHGQVCIARREGPRTPSTTTDANLDCAFVDALFDTDP